jgi:hypothetical protein
MHNDCGYLEKLFRNGHLAGFRHARARLTGRVRFRGAGDLCKKRDLLLRFTTG